MVLPAQGCGRRLRRTLAPALAAAADVPNADRYRKHFPVTAHLWILLLHVLTGSASLRQTHAELTGTPEGFARLGLPPETGISRSQLARSSTSRPTACAETLFAAVVDRVRRRRRGDPVLAKLQQVQAVDSSFLRLSAQLCPWSRHKRHVPGIKLQTAFDLAGGMPTTLRLTGCADQDVPALAARDLTALTGWTLLIDLGYYGHQLFVHLRDAGVSFICRLHPQAGYRVEADQVIDPQPTADGDVVLSDQRITLGSPNNRRGAVLPDMRLVVSRNRAGVVHRFVTDRWDLGAADVVALYRKRWQIELFFRFLKHQLQVLHPLGQSPEAVWLTLLVAATVAVLGTLTEAARPADVTRVGWLRALGRVLAWTAQVRQPRPSDTS